MYACWACKCDSIIIHPILANPCTLHSPHSSKNCNLKISFVVVVIALNIFLGAIILPFLFYNASILLKRVCISFSFLTQLLLHSSRKFYYNVPSSFLMLLLENQIPATESCSTFLLATTPSSIVFFFFTYSNLEL